MLSSFTNDEKKVLSFLIVLMAVGMVTMSYSRKQPEPLFMDSYQPAKNVAGAVTAGSGSVSGTRVSGAGAMETTASLASAMTAQGSIDLNTANVDVLASIPGVGPSLAGEICSYRAAHGAFRSFEDLDNVKGIGPAKLAKIREYVCIGGGASGASPVVGSGVAGSSGAPVAANGLAGAQSVMPVAVPARTAAPVAPQSMVPGAQQFASVGAPAAAPLSYAPPARVAFPADQGIVNINTAAEAELATLKGVGPVLAKRIIEYRLQRGAFPNVNALEDVKGIGPKILENNRARMVVR